MPEPVNGVLVYLGWLNLVLAVFNMLPAFPLDGGRVLRSILWFAKGNIRWATRVASAIGSGFGMFLIVIGLLSFISGGFITGIWYFLIGMFIRGAALTSYRQVLVRNALSGETIAHFMQPDPSPCRPQPPFATWWMTTSISTITRCSPFRQMAPSPAASLPTR